MFDTIKIYRNKEISLEEVISQLTSLGYLRQDNVSEEGDFSLKGDTLEIFLVNFNFPVRVEWEFDKIDKIYSFDKTLKKKIIDFDFIIAIPYIKKFKKKKYSEDLPLDAVLRIKKGDFIVHSQYGVAKYLGIKKMKIKDEEDYFFALEYQNKDMLYVSKENAHLIQKYVSFTSKPPKLTRLGSKEWIKTKEKVEKGIKTFAIEILKRQAQRKISGKLSFSADTEWQQMFEKKFPYKLTDDQAKALTEVKADMQTCSCMDRLICGDVGFGKTEIALRAAFKAVMDNKQVAILVPTTLLAYQHYMTFKERVSKFPINVEMLSRFRTSAQQKKIVAGLVDGKIDVIVGTHRMLSKDVAFKDLGLLVVDEEQRFGVTHKERIKNLKVGVDVITLTATPIPRTLYMGLVGIKEISIIKTPPKERLSIQTKTIEFEPKVLAKIIVKEVKRKGQVFFVHNRVESIAKIALKVKKELPDNIRIAVVHGQLSAKEIESTMLKFVNDEIDCLFSTAIVESGIDIPKANTIIINDAHKFGLSDLHQLRGRVGRFNVQAFAYLVVPKRKVISSDATRRLHLIEEFSHLGSGFDIAMSDLELRGAGNILGPQQHGFVWMVGFDLYCRLLKKEINYMRELFAAVENNKKT